MTAGQPAAAPPPAPPRYTQTKAIVGAVIAVLATFWDSIARASSPTWQTYVGALVAAVLAHQGVFWATYKPRPIHRQ